MTTLTLHSGSGLEVPTPERRPSLRLVPDDSTHTIQAVVADGNGLVRAGMRLLLEDQADVTVTGEAATGEEAIELARRMHPDVVLLDSALPGVSALEATRQILAQAPRGGVSVLMLSAGESGDSVLGALRAGVRGLLVKDSSPGELLRAVRVVARGDALLSPRLTGLLIESCVS